MRITHFSKGKPLQGRAVGDWVRCCRMRNHCQVICMFSEQSRWCCEQIGCNGLQGPCTWSLHSPGAPAASRTPARATSQQQQGTRRAVSCCMRWCCWWETAGCMAGHGRSTGLHPETQRQQSCIMRTSTGFGSSSSRLEIDWTVMTALRTHTRIARRPLPPAEVSTRCAAGCVDQLARPGVARGRRCGAPCASPAAAAALKELAAL